MLNANYTLTLNFTHGTHYTTPPIRGAQGVKGETGNGIDRIELTDTSGAVKTYTIYFTDGTTTTFEVTDGEVTEAVLDDATIVQTNTDNAPYLFRKSGGGVLTGRKEVDTLVGGTVVGNQLFDYDNTTLSVGDMTITKQGNGVYRFNGTRATTSTGNLSPTLPANHVYWFRSGRSESDIVLSNNGNWKNLNEYCTKPSSDIKPNLRVNVGTYTNVDFRPQIFDLTAMFGSTIADYVYTLEQGTAGSGIAWLKSYGFFTAPYYAYDSGSLVSVSGLQSHDTTGKNLFDGVLEQGTFNNDGSTANSSTRIRSDFMKVVQGSVTISTPTQNVIIHEAYAYDNDKNFIAKLLSSGTATASKTVTVPQGATYIRFSVRRADNTNIVPTGVQAQAEFGSTATAYEAYTKHTYPLDDSITLRGVLKLVDGKLVYDGDEYASSGAVTRKYGIVDLGTLTWQYQSSWGAWYTDYRQDIKGTTAGSEYPKFISEKYKTITTSEALAPAYTDIGISSTITASSGCRILVKNGSSTTTPTGNLAYELATATTETADPYTNPQIVDPHGTEQYVGSPIPVGHKTDYPLTLTDTMPTANGTYTMTLTVANGKRSVSWT